MKKSQKTLILRLNRNNFPHEIHRYLYTDPSLAYEKKRPQTNQLLKSWYQENFLKNNRWNKTSIYSMIKHYSDQEILKLDRCFQILFDSNRTYNQTFTRFIREFQDHREADKKGLRLKVDQETFKDIIKYFGDLRRAGKINNANHEIAKVLKKFLQPDVPFESATILDRLKNKKGYY